MIFITPTTPRGARFIHLTLVQAFGGVGNSRRNQSNFYMAFDVQQGRPAMQEARMSRVRGRRAELIDGLLVYEM